MERKKSRRPEQPTRERAQEALTIPQWLLEDADTLREIIQWWKSREATAMDAMERRPLFVGKTRNSGIRVNTVILDRALDKTRQEKLKTGGNLSQLVEWLLWIYIGSPDDVVERPTIR